MALIKSVDTPYGIQAEYWKIISNEFLPQVEKYRITVALFFNKKARKDKKNPIDYYTWETNTEYNTKNETYNFLKTIPDLSGATDDID